MSLHQDYADALSQLDSMARQRDAAIAAKEAAERKLESYDRIQRRHKEERDRLSAELAEAKQKQAVIAAEDTGQPLCKPERCIHCGCTFETGQHQGYDLDHQFEPAPPQPAEPQLAASGAIDDDRYTTESLDQLYPMSEQPGYVAAIKRRNARIDELEKYNAELLETATIWHKGIADRKRLRAKCARQRKELRRLNRTRDFNAACAADYHRRLADAEAENAELKRREAQPADIRLTAKGLHVLAEAGALKALRDAGYMPIGGADQPPEEQKNGR